MLKKSVDMAHCFLSKEVPHLEGFLGHFLKLSNLGFFGMIFYQEKAKKTSQCRDRIVVVAGLVSNSHIIPERDS